MLLLRPNCEHYDKDLTYDASDAMICSFECTFCRDCVERVLANVCPNCGGGFIPRPIRPQESLKKHPASLERVHKPIDAVAQRALIDRYGDVLPEQR